MDLKNHLTSLERVPQMMMMNKKDEIARGQRIFSRKIADLLRSSTKTIRNLEPNTDLVKTPDKIGLRTISTVSKSSEISLRHSNACYSTITQKVSICTGQTLKKVQDMTKLPKKIFAPQLNFPTEKFPKRTAAYG